VINIFVGCLFIVVGVVNIFIGIKNEINLNGYVKKSSISEAFKGTDWTKHTFRCGETLIKDVKGNEYFYPTKEIDAVIGRINKLISDELNARSDSQRN